MSLELKIKSKHLGEEAKIIRFEERKLLKRAKYLIVRDGDRRFYRDDETGKWVTTELDKVFHQHWKLLSHRTEDVRNENRATFLARAFLKGQKFTDVERSTKDLGKLSVTILPRTLKMVQKYGKPKATMEELKVWAGLS